jgi:cold shock CspA family protein
MEDVGGEDLTEGTEIEFDIEQAPKGPPRRTSFGFNHGEAVTSR